MADEAVGGRAVEDGVAAFGTFFIVRRTGEGEYVVGGIFHAFLTQGRPPRRHDADAAFGDGLLDLLGRTAPQPVVVGEVGEAGLAFGIRAVALDAVGVEQVFTETLSLRVCRDLFHRHIGKFAVYGRKLGVGILHFFFILVGAGPAYCAFVVAQTGIDIQIADTEQPNQDIEVEPPTRQGVVVFLDAVPVVARGFHIFALGRHFHFVLR